MSSSASSHGADSSSSSCSGSSPDDGRASRHCPGRGPGMPCRFSTTEPGLSAKIHHRQLQCILCSQTAFQAALRTRQGKGRVTQILKKLRPYEREDALQHIEHWAPNECASFRWKSSQPVQSKTKKEQKEPSAATTPSGSTCHKKDSEGVFAREQLRSMFGSSAACAFGISFGGSERQYKPDSAVRRGTETIAPALRALLM
eukprot:s5533_g5.t1